MMRLINGFQISDFSDSSPAVFEYKDGVCRLYIKRVYCATGCELIVLCDGNGNQISEKASYKGAFSGMDLYEAEFSALPGLYYLTFAVQTEEGTLYVHNEGDETHGQLRQSLDGCGRFQISVFENAAPPDEAFADANMYHIFVDRFYKSGKSPKRSDAVYYDDWDNGVPEYVEYPGMDLKNNTFFGGDLYGVAEKLDYLHSLGIDIIYLSPIFRAYSNHKYDPGDYTVVDECFGGENAFTELCEKAHGLGMKIVLDGVFDHTGDDSVYFNRYKKYGDGGAYNDPGSHYRGWYRFRNYPDDYECWWGVKCLPQLDNNNEELYGFFTGKDGIIRKYLRLGADGWRLDVADELPDRLLDGIKAAAEAEKPGSIVIGEVWEDASNKIAYGKRRRYFTSRQLDSVMNYPLKNAVIKYVTEGDSEEFSRVFTLIQRHYPDRTLPYLMNFLGTHDTERILTVLGGDPDTGLPGSVLVNKKMSKQQYVTAKKRFYLAFSLLCFCPGIVSVYYGDEAGMQGYHDPFNRMPYPWGREDKAMIKKVSTLLKSRKKYRGGADIVFSDGAVLGIARGEYLYLSNASDRPVTLTVGGYKCRSFDGDSRPLTLPPATYKVLKRK